MYLRGLTHTHWLRMKTGCYLLTFEKCISVIGREFFCFVFSEKISQSLPMNYLYVLHQEFSPNILPASVCGECTWPGSGMGVAAPGTLVCSCAGGDSHGRTMKNKQGNLNLTIKSNPGEHKRSLFSLMSALHCLLITCLLLTYVTFKTSRDCLWCWLFRLILDLLIFSFW